MTRQDNEELLQGIITTGTKLFYRFSNADGKTWLMPARNMQVGMNLYQPSGEKGKLMKALFPILHDIPFVRRAIHAETLRCDLTDELAQMLYRLFHENNLEFSIFCGTPCVHQKITMQLSKGNRILGYCKLTDSDEIAMLFDSESKILSEFAKKGMTGIPECLFCGKLQNGINLFIQNTVKTGKSRVLHRWTSLHDDFLDILYRNTRKSLVFEDSDYYRTLIELKSHTDWLPEGIDRTPIIHIIAQVLARYHYQTVEFSAYHADFTPWNMFVENGKLFVFDWEYARLTYPPFLDHYHFFTQTAIFERHWQANEIIAFLQSSEAGWVDKETYVFYLLDVIARFTVREKGNVTDDILRSMKIWNDLLIYLCR